MFKFANPEYLIALWLIPVLIVLYILFNRNRKRLLEKFADKQLHKSIMYSFSGNKSKIKFGMILTAFTLLILAFANPQVGTKMQEVKQTGIDVYILLDVSRSMQAEDIKPNRLEKAKYQISNLIQKLRGDRIGLIIFSGEAYIQFPLTTDYSAANLFLSAVDFNSVPQPGTAIASAIKMAVQSFDTATTDKAVIVITDGEDHEGDIRRDHLQLDGLSGRLATEPGPPFEKGVHDPERLTRRPLHKDPVADARPRRSTDGLVQEPPRELPPESSNLV